MMNGLLRFGSAVVLIAATSAANAGLFGFGSHRSDCCETECCETECCEPVGCADECGSHGCLTKRPGMLSRLFGCFKKRSSSCCETDCCEVECCDTGCAPQAYGSRPPVYSGYGVAQPAPLGQSAPAPSTAPTPRQAPQQAAPAPKAAPAPPQAPSDEAEVYFPSRFRGSADVSGRAYPGVR